MPWRSGLTRGACCWFPAGRRARPARRSKYPVEAVDYVELDPLILAVAGRLLPDRLADPRIHVINTDGRLFVRQTDERYDVIIVDVPAPSTSQINRFYTREFFAEAHRILTPGGVLAFPLESYENYLSKELARIIGVEQRTLAEVYRHVLILPGGRVFFWRPTAT